LICRGEGDNNEQNGKEKKEELGRQKKDRGSQAKRPPNAGKDVGWKKENEVVKDPANAREAEIR